MKKRKGRGDSILLFIIILLLIGFGVLFIKQHLILESKPLTPLPTLSTPTQPTPTQSTLTKSIPNESLPKIAIIIDDFGYNLSPHIKELLELDHPITVAVLPRLHYTADIGTLADLSGKEVILHLPLESHGYPNRDKDPGPGAIFCNLSEEEIRKRVRENLEDLPQAVGLNTHMGSKATEDKRVMSTVLDEIKDKDLYFVDSLTSRNSTALKIAQEKGIPSASRDIFLDNKDDPVYINNQLNKLILKAKKEGKAIGIGHVHRRSTLKVLKERLPRLREEGVELVFASEIVK